MRRRATRDNRVHANGKSADWEAGLGRSKSNTSQASQPGVSVLQYSILLYLYIIHPPNSSVNTGSKCMSIDNNLSLIEPSTV